MLSHVMFLRWNIEYAQDFYIVTAGSSIMR